MKRLMCWLGLHNMVIHSYAKDPDGLQIICTACGNIVDIP